MRSRSFGIVAFLACATMAGAVPIGAVQAQPPSLTDWSGFYVGGGLGGSVGTAQTDTAVQSSGAYFTTTDPGQIADSGDGDLSQARFAGGIGAGYGWQFGNVVVGIEASASTLFFDDQRSAGQEYLSSPGETFAIEQNVEADWQATLRPRLGWAEDNWLAYVTAGLAVTKLEIDYLFTDTAFNAISQSSTSRLRAGWTVGLGGEYALGPNWSLRADYLYADFGRLESSSVVNNNGGFGGAVLEHSADLRTHTVLIGVSYRFSGF